MACRDGGASANTGTARMPTFYTDPAFAVGSKGIHRCIADEDDEGSNEKRKS